MSRAGSMSANQVQLQEAIEGKYANINNLDSVLLSSYKTELSTYQNKYGTPKWGGVDYSLYDSTSLGKPFDPTDPAKTEGSGGDQYSGGLPPGFGFTNPQLFGYDLYVASQSKPDWTDTGDDVVNVTGGGPTIVSGPVVSNDKANTSNVSHTNVDDNGQLKVDDAGNKTNTDDALKKQKNKTWEMYAVGGAIALGVVLIVASR